MKDIEKRVAEVENGGSGSGTNIEEVMEYMREKELWASTVFIVGAKDEDDARKVLKKVSSKDQIEENNHVKITHFTKKQDMNREGERREAADEFGQPLIQDDEEITPGQLDGNGDGNARSQTVKKKYFGTRVRLNNELFELVLRNKAKLKNGKYMGHVFIKKYLPKLEQKMRPNAVAKMKEILATQEDDKVTLEGRKVCLKQGFLYVDNSAKIRYRKRRL